MRGLAALAALLALAACGRVGPPRAPGPPEAQIYPRAYPYVPRGAAGATTGAVPPEVANPAGDPPINRPVVPR